MVKASLGPEWDLAHRLKQAEKVTAGLATQPVLQSASTTQSDGSVGLESTQTVVGGTVLKLHYGPGTPTAVVDPTNGQWPVFLRMGQTLVSGAASGSVFSLARPVGNAPLVIAGFNTGGQATGFNVYDKAGNVVLATDETSGFGLAGPWIPYPSPVDTNLAQWPGTTSTTLTIISSSGGFLQHPKMTFTVVGQAPSGVTGQFSVLVNGVQVGTTWNATNGFVTSIQTVTIPTPTWEQILSIQVAAQVISGAGQLRAQVTSIYGRQS